MPRAVSVGAGSPCDAGYGRKVLCVWAPGGAAEPALRRGERQNAAASRRDGEFNDVNFPKIIHLTQRGVVVEPRLGTRPASRHDRWINCPLFAS